MPQGSWAPRHCGPQPLPAPEATAQPLCRDPTAGPPARTLLGKAMVPLAVSSLLNWRRCRYHSDPWTCQSLHLPVIGGCSPGGKEKAQEARKVGGARAGRGSQGVLQGSPVWLVVDWALHLSTPPPHRGALRMAASTRPGQGAGASKESAGLPSSGPQTRASVTMSPVTCHLPPPRASLVPSIQ